MLKVISPQAAVDRLEEAGFHTNKNRIEAGLRQGVYPFGAAIKLKEYVYEVYSSLLEKWIAERSENNKIEGA